MQVENYEEVAVKCDLLENAKKELEAKIKKLCGGNKGLTLTINAARQEIVKLESMQVRLNDTQKKHNETKLANKSLKKVKKEESQRNIERTHA